MFNKHSLAPRRVITMVLCLCVLLSTMSFPVWADSTTVIASTVQGHKTAALDSSQADGRYTVTLGISTTPKITIGTSYGASQGASGGSSKPTVTRTEQHPDTINITDPMSEYVTYLGSVTLEERTGGSAWKTSTDGTPSFSGNTLTCNIAAAGNGKEYRLVYKVQVKEKYADQRIHQQQTSGKNPAKGKDGLILNGYTSVKTDLAGPVEILVPTGYRTKTEETAAQGKTILIRKEDKADGKVLEGFTFALLDSADKVSKQLVTQIDPVKNAFSTDDFAVGNYTLWETAVKGDYERITVALANISVKESANGKYFTISLSKDADVSMELTGQDSVLLVVKNKKKDDASGDNTGWWNRPGYGAGVSGGSSSRDKDKGASSGNYYGDGTSNPSREIRDPNTPTSNSGGSGTGRLPSTGGFAVEMVGLAGIALVGAGLWWKRKKKNRTPKDDNR